MNQLKRVLEDLAAAVRLDVDNVRREDARTGERLVARLIGSLQDRAYQVSQRARSTRVECVARLAPRVDTRVPSRDHGCVSATLPTGVVTFLFTDVEGSTKLLHELGDAYADALHEHRRLLREAFAANDGAEVDTQGDAFFVAFGRASDAVAAAVDAQRALSGGPIRVRMGLHTGEPRLTDEGYVGLDVHKGARIAAVGHGGQVLLSQATRALVDADVRDLGPHRLKDLSVPERIFQLEVDGLPSEFAPLKTLEAGMRNLPAPRTSFVGRTDAARLDRSHARRARLPPADARRAGRCR